MFVPGACVPRELQVRRLRLVTSVCLQATVRPDTPPPASAALGYRAERGAVAALVRPIAGRLAADIMRRNRT